MKGISSKIHGALDYTLGFYLIAAPSLFDFLPDATENLLAIIFGMAILVYSFCTDYEWGYLEELDFRTHLLFDFLTGIVLTLSPWLFGFYDRVYLPFMIPGILQIILTFISKTENQRPRNNRSFTTRQRSLSQGRLARA